MYMYVHLSCMAVSILFLCIRKCRIGYPRNVLYFCQLTGRPARQAFWRAGGGRLGGRPDSPAAGWSSGWPVGCAAAGRAACWAGERAGRRASRFHMVHGQSEELPSPHKRDSKREHDVYIYIYIYTLIVFLFLYLYVLYIATFMYLFICICTCIYVHICEYNIAGQWGGQPLPISLIFALRVLY